MRKALFCLTALIASNAAAASPVRTETQDILNRFAADYAQDPTLVEPAEFAVDVAGTMWTVQATPRRGSTPAVVRVTASAPVRPTFVFKMSVETLRRLDQGALNALTGAAQAREGDPTEVGLDTMPGFEPAGDPGKMLELMFHFWTRGQPEIVNFGPRFSRPVHGANAVVFYYASGLRTAWYELRPGEHVNADPADQTNPFPTLFVCTRGSASARVGGRDIALREGMTLFIPANVPHEFRNDGRESMQGIIVMFGEGA